MTWLGKFLPFGRLFSLGNLLNYRRSPYLWDTFSTEKMCINLGKKTCLAHFVSFFHKRIWSLCQECGVTVQPSSASSKEFPNERQPTG
jgi:nitrate reductase gamma subunit